MAQGTRNGIKNNTIINNVIMKRFLSITILIIACAVDSYAQVKIKLTGTLRENAEMTIGTTGSKIVITSLPFEFKIAHAEFINEFKSL